MDRHKRMARTLFFLVAAMTAGAAMLDWSQPAPQAARRPIELIALGPASSEPWGSIRIRAHPGEVFEPSDAHFVIDRDGNCLATDHWRAQHRFGEQPVVRIGVQTPPHTNVVTQRQWTTTQSLIQALQRLGAVPGPAVTVDVDDTVGAPAAAPALSVATRQPRPG
jgi:hypothetical protein